MDIKITPYNTKPSLLYYESVKGLYFRAEMFVSANAEPYGRKTLWKKFIYKKKCNIFFLHQQSYLRSLCETGIIIVFTDYKEELQFQKMKQNVAFKRVQTW